MHISKLNFTKRTYDALILRGFETVFSLAVTKRKDLLQWRGIGPVAVREVEEKLSDLGLTLGMTHPDTAQCISSTLLIAANELVVKANGVMKEAEAKREELYKMALYKKEEAKRVKLASEPLEKFLA